MRIKRYNGTVKIWASSTDTYIWAHRPGNSWPCSTLSGKRLYAEFYHGDLVDYAINGKHGVNLDDTEFNAITEDALNNKPHNHTQTPPKHYQYTTRE